MALKYRGEGSVGIRRGYSHALWAGGALKSGSTALLEMVSQRKKTSGSDTLKHHPLMSENYKLSDNVVNETGTTSEYVLPGR